MKVQLQNVGIVEKCNVEFIPGINLIVGSSGSGKSTLMRSIYNMATNEFSDSDISFGKNTMSVKIDFNGNTVEYVRSVKAKGDKFYYIVNGETYSKVGRQTLPAVDQALKIGDVDVNGDSINFNFNLQFSSPFLILGNQSTLYNVLTYRSSFDISSINDYYISDIRNNASDIATNVKLKERLEENLESLNKQEQKLSPIEKLYSDYTSYKHKSEFLTILKSLCVNMKCINDAECKLKHYSETLDKISSAIALVSSLKEMYSYKEMYNLYNEIRNKASKCTALIAKYDSTIDTLQRIIEFSELNKSVKSLSSINELLKCIDEKITSSNNIISNEHFVYDVLKYKSQLARYNKYCSIICILNTLDANKILEISNIASASALLHSVKEINDTIVSIDDKILGISNKISQFSICPLCGGHLNGSHKEH